MIYTKQKYNPIIFFFIFYLNYLENYHSLYAFKFLYSVYESVFVLFAFFNNMYFFCIVFFFVVIYVHSDVAQSVRVCILYNLYSNYELLFLFKEE